MKRVISIHKTKGIESLDFSLPEKHGVYLLVGSNGTGKTTILTSLHRVCNNKAFSLGFRSAQESRTVDSYKDAKISYQAGSHCVSFSKREKKWSPTPKQNGFVLSEFGFADSVFIKATDSRLSPREEEIRKGNLEPADEEVKNALNKLFDTDRFTRLQRLRSVYGRGRAFIHFYVMSDGKKGFYSEKSFSAGELAMLRLVDRLRDVAPHSLMLLDEAELALHPCVQIRLLDYLRKISQEKQLTVFVSTHSPSMIRATRASHIMLLNEEPEQKGHFSIISPCYPSYAIGFIDELDNNAPDYIFCVEDDMAQLILRAILHQYLANSRNANHKNLQYRVIPIAGWPQTLQFVQNSQKMLFSNSCVRAVLDADVFDPASEDSEDTAEWKQKILAQFPGIAYNLGVTPEVALVEALEKPSPEVTAFIRERFYTDITSYTQSTKYQSCKKDKPRALAKEKLKSILSALEAHCAQSEDVIIAQLVPVLLPVMYTPALLAQVAGRILSVKK